jgi:hypothetical protein
MSDHQPAQQITAAEAQLIDAVQLRIATQRLKLAKAQAGKLRRTSA